ncbi:growth-regulating factor 9 [Rosa rugosa]|uniref:growth-regulating factor 9 n=1 Tax=Rosa rugosa TaxID=74645 RepID=UPI002B411A2C|nr:growth-regulating factor 9 [Rosa rugosa]
MNDTQVVKVKHEDDEGSSPPSIKLGLAIGGDGGDCEVVGKRRRSEFTVAQLDELEHQRLVYKYIAAGLPAPFQLVLPIWKSVAAGFSNAAFYQQYPSFLGYGGFDYRSKMDTEPGRCRRTDGKKWRCSRDVVPDEKYCEKHMHRGRHRSRKPVEASQVTSPPSTKLLKNSDGELLNSKKNLQIQTPKGLQLMAQPSNNGGVSHSRTTFSSGYHELPKNNISTVAYTTSTPSYRTAVTPAAVAPSTTAGQMTATASTCNDNKIWIGVKDYGCNYHAGNYGIIRGSRNNINVGSNISPGSGFSPKSVLQAGHMILVNCNGLYFDNRRGEELEPGRCRRTDGKKWRCKRDVLPDQKYCDRHIHRGVKQMRTFGPVTAASTSATAMNSTRPSQTTGIAGETDCAIPNTNLTMSIPARSPLMQNDEKSDSTSDSDATITDTSLAAYEQLI